jgi:hypothetical protein
MSNWFHARLGGVILPRGAADVGNDCLEQEGNPMAASLVVKLKKGDSVTALFAGELKQHFNHKGDDVKGELIMKDDGCVKIAYKVQGDAVTFTVTQSPRLFSESDQKKALQEFFG